MKTPVLSAWALPENWRKGLRPRARSGDGKFREEVQGRGPKEGHSGSHGKAVSSDSGSGHGLAEKSNGSPATRSEDELDQRILGMEKVVGAAF